MKLSHITLHATLIAATLTLTTNAMQPQNVAQFPLIKVDIQDDPNRLNFSMDAQGVTDEVLLRVAQSNPNLESLIVLGCARVTNYGINAIANGCKHLKNLDVRGCRQVTGTGIQYLVSQCHELQELKIAGCPAVNDFTIKIIVLNCPGLQHLDCSQCPLLTVIALHHVAQHCPHLTYLDISLNHLINNENLIKVLALNCPSLQILCAHRCPKINWQGIQALQNARRIIPGVIGTVICENSYLPRTFSN